MVDLMVIEEDNVDIVFLCLYNNINYWGEFIMEIDSFTREEEKMRKKSYRRKIAKKWKKEEKILIDKDLSIIRSENDYSIDRDIAISDIINYLSWKSYSANKSKSIDDMTAICAFFTGLFEVIKNNENAPIELLSVNKLFLNINKIYINLLNFSKCNKMYNMGKEFGTYIDDKFAIDRIMDISERFANDFQVIYDVKKPKIFKAKIG